MNFPSPPVPHDPRLALFLDIDGTLIEHQPHPDGARADTALVTLLRDAETCFDGALALVTGRNIEMVDRLFAPMRMPVAGLYGLEHRLAWNGPATLAGEPEDLGVIADQLQLRFKSAAGVYFERKGAVLAVHTRAAPAVHPEVEAAAQEALAQLSGRYRLVVGHAGLEFLPVEALKSAAIERFMACRPFTGRRPVFIGDDVSDEVGFQHVEEVGGITIRVRPQGPTEARYALPDVAAVRSWLRAVIEALTPARGRRSA